MREVLGSRLLLRLAGCGLAGSPRWVLCPAAYHDGLALALLGQLGGPEAVVLRHPHATRFGAHGGGEVAVAASDLEAVLRAMLVEGAAVSPAVGALLKEARFAPEGDEAGCGVLLVEEAVGGAALPQDGAKGWYDPTQRAYCLQAVMPPPSASDGKGGEGGGGEGDGGRHTVTETHRYIDTQTQTREVALRYLHVQLQKRCISFSFFTAAAGPCLEQLHPA